MKEYLLRKIKDIEFINKGHNRWKSEYGWNVWHIDKLKLGDNTDIGYGTLLFAHEGIEIADNVQIGSYCSIYSLNTENNTKGKIIIKKNACIGAHSVIFPNVVIEEGEMIKARSIVYVNKEGKRFIK